MHTRVVALPRPSLLARAVVLVARALVQGIDALAFITISFLSVQFLAYKYKNILNREILLSISYVLDCQIYPHLLPACPPPSSLRHHHRQFLPGLYLNDLIYPSFAHPDSAAIFL
ncbi:hypothetical protein AVAK2825_14670 [Acidovorax sp. SUPP2825]|nr:hypothetical protein AVAK2825_14670 [Acidovorax sp. SUPP2825]